MILDVNGNVTDPNQKGYIVTDDDLERVLKLTEQYQKKAKDQRKQWSKAQWHTLRARCKRDLFFLVAAVLGYDRLQPKLHGDFCKWIKENFAKFQFLLALLPRTHYKTTTKTVGHNIQVALPYTSEDQAYDPEGHIELPHPMELGTNVRILIEHEVIEEAARFLFIIMKHFTTNPMLMALFPECVPSRKDNIINKYELELPRNVYFSEPTFDTFGLTTRSQGRHYNLISPDDIYGVQARESPAESQRAKDHVDGLFGFMDRPAISKYFPTGTRYKFDDVYGHMKDKFGANMAVYRRKVEEVNPVTGKKEIIFPEQITPLILESIKTNKKVYYSEWLNDPEEIGEGFLPEWWREFEWLDENRFTCFDVNPNHGTVVHVRDCFVSILIDPGEQTGGFIVNATDYWMRNFTLLALPIEMPSPALVEFLFSQVIRWQPPVVSIEADAAQHLLGDWIKSEQRHRGIYFQIHEYYTKKQAKPKRIESLGNYYAALRLWHNRKQVELKKEFERFGKTRDIHILDALAQLSEVEQRGYAPGSRGIISAMSQFPETGRDFETGYSAIN